MNSQNFSTTIPTLLGDVTHSIRGQLQHNMCAGWTNGKLVSGTKIWGESKRVPSIQTYHHCEETAQKSLEALSWGALPSIDFSRKAILCILHHVCIHLEILYACTSKCNVWIWQMHNCICIIQELVVDAYGIPIRWQTQICQCIMCKRKLQSPPEDLFLPLWISHWMKTLWTHIMRQLNSKHHNMTNYEFLATKPVQS